ncbi:MAG: hypothetical protein ISS92_04065 [Candidatus Omnitrophica bacterium]|nr:hypothetical protein [Candidatus Omnitrophota bacterium]
MKKLLYIFIFLLISISTQTLALDSGSVDIKVVINKAPNIESFQPDDGYRIIEGDMLQISVIANDPNNDILQYRFIIKGIIKRPWSNEASFNYVLTGDDIGLNNIKAEVTDAIDIIQTEEIEIYVFRRPLDLP